MIAGINKLYILSPSNIANKGFLVGNNRIGLAVTGDWAPLDFSRDTAQLISDYKDGAYTHTVKFSKHTASVQLINTAKGLHLKTVVVVAILNSGESVIIGVENPLRVVFAYTTGKQLPDSVGYSITMACRSKSTLEFYSIPTEPEPPAYTTIKYGLLYNWYITQDSNIIPLAMSALGWGFTPYTTDGWGVLMNYIYAQITLGVIPDIGYGNIIKSKRQVNSPLGSPWSTSEHPRWDENLYGLYGVDALSLNMLPGGIRNYSSGIFSYLGKLGNYWSNTMYSFQYAYLRELTYQNATLGGTYRYYNYGYSIRLVRIASTEEQTFEDGTLCDPYVGNDGKIYRTVKVGTQVWLADNLAETKYRDGSDIPNVTDNTQWAALTTGACCAYNNDPNNV